MWPTSFNRLCGMNIAFIYRRASFKIFSILHLPTNKSVFYDKCLSLTYILISIIEQHGTTFKEIKLTIANNIKTVIAIWCNCLGNIVIWSSMEFLFIALLLWFFNILLWTLRSSSWDTHYFWLQIASELMGKLI